MTRFSFPRGPFASAAAGLALVALGAHLALTANDYAAGLVFSTAMYVLLACGWNLIGGLAGAVSFGQVAFFGLGAYLTAILVVHAGTPLALTLPLAALGAGLVAWPLGLIMLRLSGIFFALGMLGLARVLAILANALDLTGGPMGMTVPATAGPRGPALAALAAACGGFLVTLLLLHSRWGLRMRAVADDPVAAAASGVAPAPPRIFAFVLAALMAGGAGGLYVANVGYIDPASAFSGTIELETVLMVLAGGIRTAWGPVVGGIAISLLGTFLWARFPTEEQIILGALIIGLALRLPDGVLGGRRRPRFRAPSSAAAPPLSLFGREGGVLMAPDRKGGGEVLAAEGLGRRFGGLVALAEVTFSVAAGEILAIIGPNGAGKTTLFNLLTAHLPPSTGHVRLHGVRLRRLPPPFRLARAGVVRTFQTSRLFPSLSVWETLLLAALSRGAGWAAAERRARALLTALDLADAADHFPDRLSPAQARLVEIGRALALEPAVLLLDEAMAGLNEAEVARLQTILRRLAEAGMAIIAIEHVIPAIAPLAGRIVVLDQGRVLASGPPEGVLNDPRVIDAYLGPERLEAAA